MSRFRVGQKVRIMTDVVPNIFTPVDMGTIGHVHSVESEDKSDAVYLSRFRGEMAKKYDWVRVNYRISENQYSYYFAEQDIEPFMMDYPMVEPDFSLEEIELGRQLIEG